MKYIALLVFVGLFICFALFEAGTLCSPVCPETHYVGGSGGEMGLELAEI